jgi:steroid 5-alpha reductase family enzyme
LVTLVLAVAGGVALLMTGAWLIQRATGNASWVDAIWPLATGLAGIAFALAPVAHWPPNARQIVLAAVIGLWALRLAGHIARRTAGAREDPRYHELRTTWGEAAQSRFFWFFQLQGVTAVFLALALLLAAYNPAPFPTPLDLAGISLVLLAIAGEALSDAQLAGCKRRGASLCDSGLWRFSRHPNYFFEWLGWWAYPLMAIDPRLDYGLGWAALLAPAFMYWLLAHVSGVPPLERHMLAKHGAAYAAYQQRTPAFFPGVRGRS